MLADGKPRPRPSSPFYGGSWIVNYNPPQRFRKRKRNVYSLSSIFSSPLHLHLLALWNSIAHHQATFLLMSTAPPSTSHQTAVYEVEVEVEMMYLTNRARQVSRLAGDEVYVNIRSFPLLPTPRLKPLKTQPLIVSCCSLSYLIAIHRIRVERKGRGTDTIPTGESKFTDCTDERWAKTVCHDKTRIEFDCWMRLRFLVNVSMIWSSSLE